MAGALYGLCALPLGDHSMIVSDLQYLYHRYIVQKASIVKSGPTAWARGTSLDWRKTNVRHLDEIRGCESLHKSDVDSGPG